MKSTKIILVASLFVLSVFIFDSCNDSSPLVPQQSKSVNITLKVANKNLTNGIANIIPVDKGKLTLENFNISLSKINIQENSGLDGEFTGDNQDSGADNGSEVETPDVTLTGPFSFDIASAVVNIGTFQLYAGTFKKVDMYFVNSQDQLFQNNTIVINGEYENNNGIKTTFSLNSAFAKITEASLAGNGIILTDSSNAEVTISFDFNKLFYNLNFSNAIQTDGKIIIDNSNNVQLLNTFENNLSNSIELE